MKPTGKAPRNPRDARAGATPAGAADPASLPAVRCPVTGQPLSLLEDGALAAARERLRSGALRHLGADAAHVELEGALATPDGRIVYPIVEGILVLLPALALVDRDDELIPESFGLPPVTGEVMRFYDETGWSREEGGAYADAGLFEDLRPESAAYIHACHARVSRYLPPSGTFLLDVASGPVQYDDYLAYSEHYARRVCADVSFTALRAARERLGDRGVYVQCDITRLPFADGAMDAFVSLHTVYHVPAERQLLALGELERVLRPGGRGVVVYSWGPRSLANTLLTFNGAGLLEVLLPAGVFERLRNLARARRERAGEDGAAAGPYFRPHGYRWFRTNVATRPTWDLSVWRSVNVPFMKRWVRGARGARFLARLFDFEERHPRFCGRFGQYPLLAFTKGPA